MALRATKERNMARTPEPPAARPAMEDLAEGKQESESAPAPDEKLEAAAEPEQRPWGMASNTPGVYIN